MEDESTEYDDLPTPTHCALCGSEAWEYMGTLGQIAWFRCQACHNETGVTKA